MYTSPKDLNTYSEETENKQNAKYTHHTSKFGSYAFSRWEKVG
jgi:hypothetical protein